VIPQVIPAMTTAQNHNDNLHRRSLVVKGETHAVAAGDPGESLGQGGNAAC